MTTAAPPIESPPASRAVQLRARLGIPADAERVLIFGETSHWDPNWLRTADEYYEGQIVPVMRSVIEELRDDPDRVFAIESTFFLERFWQRHPEHQDELYALLRSRRLRLTGTGITTPDTVIPNPEAILRDYLLGQEWLRTIDIDDEPRLAYLPDDFGYAPTLPSLLAELGFTQAAITRIDGAYFIGADYRSTKNFPLANSSADALQNKYRSADFIWVAPDGREVLCHWNPFTYFQGDMLASVGIIRWMGRTYGLSWRTGRHIARRVAAYVKALASLARTPYLFCPIGCDFNPPIPKLGALVRRYNREIYPTTGTWLLSAGLDDYMDLVDTERYALPRIALDLNPYWMGFYATRPEAKVRHQRITRKLLAAEAAHSALELCGHPSSSQFEAVSDRVWRDLAFANHHDFITGTSPDRIWLQEQAPLLQAAEAAIDDWSKDDRPPPRARSASALQVRRSGHRLLVETPHAKLTFDEERGGTLVSWRSPDGREHLDGPSFDLVLYRDSGGLWRLGHEFAGGQFRILERGRHQPASIRATCGDHWVRLDQRVRLGGQAIERAIWIFDHRPEVIVEVEGGVPLGTSLCLDLETGIQTQTVEMDVPGGVVERPRRKLYDPTFWPAFTFAHVADVDRGWVAYLSGPASVSVNALGRTSAMVQRNAPRERAFGLLPVLAHPARGTDPGFRVQCAFAPTSGSETSSFSLQRRGHALLQTLALHGPQARVRPVHDLPVELDGPAMITALKAATRGPGWIVRLTGRMGHRVNLRCPSVRLRRVARCDARERDRHEIPVVDGEFSLILDGDTVSLRLET